MIEINLKNKQSLPFRGKKIAIVYDRVNKFGGAERVLLTLHEMFPDAPLYTSVVDEKNAPWADVFPKIHTSFLQNIPFAKNNHELFGWLMPLAFESFDFGTASSGKNYDLVISVTSEAAKGIITGTNTLHICYILTPTRYLWSGYEEYFKNSVLKLLSKPVINYLRWWDKVAATRPDKIIAISTEVQKRIKKYYNRDPEIIFPPVETLNSHRNELHDAYYLYVGRLVKYKKIDLLIDTFNELGLPLVIVGVGSEAFSLKHKAKSNIKFLGQISDEELSKVYMKAKAFIMPQDEDFGITSVEAQSFGIPVIAFKSGGALDTVVNGKTGIFFDRQNKESLKQAIAKFDTIRFNDGYLVTNAKRFSKERFKRQLQRSLIRTYLLWRGRN
ncbi:MAG: glycosyltransferase [Patescibacteria group bacterium]